MAKGKPPPFVKKGGPSAARPNPFAGKKAPPFGGGASAEAPPFKKGGKVGRK